MYGSGNILGYTRIRKRSDSDKRNAIGDKSVPTFAIMPEEAETVRLIFKWYVDGLGLKRIKNQLLIKQRKNSSGQVKWFESVISNILSNPMYIGKQYQCQTEVTDFLEHTVKKNKPEDFVLVEGDFEPIISEELFDRVQEIKRQRYIQNHIGEQHYGYKISLDKWRCKLECSCGSKFQQYIWRTNARGDTAIGYTCRHRVMDGSAFHRIQQGLRINDACSMPSIPAWKFDFMALRIFSDIWKLNKDCIKAVQLYLIQYCTENRDTSQVMDVEGVQKQIKHFEGQIKEITKSYIAGRVTATKYEEKSKEYISKLEYLRTHLDEMQSSTNRKIHTPKDGQSLCRMFSALMDCSGEWIDKYIVENFVDKIVVQ